MLLVTVLVALPLAGRWLRLIPASVVALFNILIEEMIHSRVKETTVFGLNLSPNGTKRGIDMIRRPVKLEKLIPFTKTVIIQFMIRLNSMESRPVAFPTSSRNVR